MAGNLLWFRLIVLKYYGGSHSLIGGRPEPRILERLMDCISCGSIANVAVTCWLCEGDPILSPSVPGPATAFVCLTSSLFKYDLDGLSRPHQTSICFGKARNRAIIQNSRGSFCPIIVTLPHNLGIPLYAGYISRAGLASQSYCKDGICRQQPRTKIKQQTVSQ